MCYSVMSTSLTEGSALPGHGPYPDMVGVVVVFAMAIRVSPERGILN